MKTNVKHFKFVNSKTGNAIYYHTLTVASDQKKVKVELDKIRDQVASQNGMFTETIYWEEVKED